MDLNTFTAKDNPLASAQAVSDYVKENTQEAIEEGLTVDGMNSDTLIAVATLDALLAVAKKLDEVKEALAK